MPTDVDGLNDTQREAVNWDAGPALVLAGPGSGKTRVLTTRVIRLLAASPGCSFRVLGLTFTTKAAAEMRSRVVEQVPAAEHRRVRLTTFHSFCGDVLRQHGNHVGVAPDFEIISTKTERREILERVLKELQDGNVPARFKPPGFRPDVGKVLDVIDHCFEALATEDQIRGATKDAEWGAFLAAAFGRYRRELGERNAYDFGSLLLLAHELFEARPKVVALIRKVYRHLCVDEFQDTNVAQYRVLRQLAAPDPSTLFVVADDDQVIYEWNGASPTRLAELRADFSAEVLQLPTNYRCPPAVIALANNLIRHNATRSPGKKPLEAGKAGCEGDSVRCRLFGTLDDELGWVAAEILGRDEAARRECVVLGRTNHLADRAAKAISAAGQPTGVHAVVLSRKDDFRSAPFRWLCAALKLLARPADRRAVEAACKTFHHIEGVHVSLQDVVQTGAGSDYFGRWFAAARGARGVEPGTAEFCDWVLGQGRPRDSFPEFLRRALAWLEGTAAYGQHSISEHYADYRNERAAWDAIYKEIVAEFGRDALTLETLIQEIALASKTAPVPDGAVPCMTVHGAKGLEFDHVYLVGMTEGSFPLYLAVAAGDRGPQMEEERRSCFVAITRTERTLTLTHSRREGAWKREPSRFLKEMEVTWS